MPNTENLTRVVAQVAVEAIVNLDGDGYEDSTMVTVLHFGICAGVADLYLDALRVIIAERS